MNIARVLVSAGARAAEAALLSLLDGLVPARGLDPALLARPVRVVVPSRSLRLHLVQRIAAHRGRALAGLVVQTLPSMTAQILASDARPAGHADPVLEILVRRRAAQVPALEQVLGGLDDGWSAATRPVADLLAAGLVAERDAEALARRIASLGDGVATPDDRLRAISMIHLASLVQQDLESLGLALHADGHRAAAARVRADPAVVQARVVVLYGLVDLAGAELTLVDDLVAHAGATVVLSAPAPPAAQLGGQAGPDLDGPVGALVERLKASAKVQVDPTPAPAPILALHAAPGRLAEARQAARQARQLVDQGVPAHAVAIVARDLADWGPRLRPELDRLGLAWSGVGGQAPAGPALRRLRALVDLLHRRGDAPVDRWLDALVRVPGGPALPVEDLRTAMRSLGKARLQDVAALDLAAVPGLDRDLPLPVRTRLVEVSGAASSDPGSSDPAASGSDGGDDGGEAGAVARRRVPRAMLEAAVAAARALVQGLDDPAARPLSDWATLLRGIAREGLGWGDPEAAWRALVAALDGLLERVDPLLMLDRDEARLLLSPALEGAAAGPIGGKGGGVQLLSAVEARGRTFQHLLVVGLSRGELPRAGRGDPLLPEAIRQRLAELLPDLPLAAARQAVERDLLSHLLSAAPHVDLSWPATDDDGKVVPPSPLVERLRLACPELPVQRLPALGSRQDPPLALQALPRPPQEHALYRALHAPDDDLSAACVAQSLGGDAAAARVARARAAVRRELDAPPGRLGAGPYLGFVGPVGAGADPRAGALYATTLEAVATCGWRAFLERVLRLEPPPDAEGALPGVDSRLVGTVVHRVLETLARRALQAAGAPEQHPDLESAALAAGAPMAWPDPQGLARLVEQVARETALEEGLALPGLWRILARASLPDLEIAQAAEAAGPPPLVVAVEQEARVSVHTPMGSRTVSFRADRVDRDPAGLVLTDYKTGKPISTLKTPEKRHQAELQAVAGGTKLQGALYARALQGSSQGRYLYLRAALPLEPDDPLRSALVPPSPEWRADFDLALDQAVSTVIAAWLEGALPPRLIGPDQQTPPACSWCEVRQACLQGDSSARLRQHAWAVGPDAPVGVEARAHALWWLGSRKDLTDPTDPQGGEA